MAVQIITKNSATAGSVPAADALVQGELAINVKDRKLFSKDADGSVFELSGSQTGTNTLQQVTDAGNTTTNDIDINGKIELKASDGSITTAGKIQASNTASGHTFETRTTGSTVAKAFIKGDGSATFAINGSQEVRLGVTDAINVMNNSGVKAVTADYDGNFIAGVSRFKVNTHTDSGNSGSSVDIRRDSDDYVFKIFNGGYANTNLSFFVKGDGSTVAAGDVKIGGTTSTPNVELKSDGSAEFSGSVSIGGTTNANTIDVYEEGSWTADAVDNNNEPQTAFATSKAKYIRFGDIVTCYVQIDYDTTGSINTSTFKFSLPFPQGAKGSGIFVPTADVNAEVIQGYGTASYIRCSIPSDVTSGSASYRGSVTYQLS